MTRAESLSAVAQARQALPAGLAVDPALPLGMLRRDAGPADLASLLGSRPEDHILPTYSGTGALFQALVRLGVGAGDGVLLPAYNCGHEVEAVLRAGAEPVFYSVDRRFGIDTDAIRRRLTGLEGRPPRALVVTHFLGVQQPLQALYAQCRSSGTLLIEDCAQALFSAGPDGPVGGVGDIAVFSLRKTLPIPVGGVAVFRRHLLDRPPEPLPPPPWLTRTGALGYRVQKALWQRRPGVGGRVRRYAAALLALVREAGQELGRGVTWLGWPQHDPEDEGYDFPAAMLRWGMDATSLRLLGAFNPAAIAAQRRRNFLALTQRLMRGGLSVPTPSLDGKTVPLYCVVAVADRTGVLKALHARGVPALDWWSAFHPAVPWGRFAQAVRLKHSLVALPVHQDLTTGHVEAMADALVAASDERYVAPFP
ncbi:DegT/DnrJ/EryC1/StrS family aminotransferase [Aquisalimonas sp.]|uniref:DegT/DnrJ/EryC1/StrS family aminotransferase n=1 Tax=Aquisalimonas sp. TaxID=1872621 RepID=UPI0025C5ECBF|nr:DegT/DnrJ/EryC1/StrS family aminotransferase [Aquisalimonas sp.]